MTVVIGIGVFPPKDEKPYFLMASDSLRIRKIQNNDGVFEDLDKDDDYQKYYNFENTLYGFAGKMDNFFMEELPIILSNLQGSFEDKAKALFKKVQWYMKNECTMDIGRCNFILGTVENGKPIVAQSLIIKEFINESKLYIEIVPFNNAIPIFIGNVDGHQDLQEKFRNRVLNAVNLNSYVIKKAAKQYVEDIADRVPDFCNKNVKIDIVR